MISTKHFEAGFTLYCADSDAAAEADTLHGWLARLPEALHARALRYRHPQDAYNYTLARLMLQAALEDRGLPPELLGELRTHAQGQAVLPGLSFSISHSGHQVVCAVAHAERRIGVDIEVVRPLEVEHLRAWFTAAEWEEISGHPQPVRRLMYLWTQKESVLKAFGAGLSELPRVRLLGADEAVFGDAAACRLFPLDVAADVLGCVCLA